MAEKVKLAILHLFSYEIRNEKLTSHSIVTKPKIQFHVSVWPENNLEIELTFHKIHCQL